MSEDFVEGVRWGISMSIGIIETQCICMNKQAHIEKIKELYETGNLK